MHVNIKYSKNEYAIQCSSTIGMLYVMSYCLAGSLILLVFSMLRRWLFFYSFVGVTPVQTFLIAFFKDAAGICLHSPFTKLAFNTFCNKEAIYIHMIT